MQKEDYDRVSAEVANLEQKNQELANETIEARSAEASLSSEVRKTHSILFHFEGEEKKKAERERLESESDSVSKQEADVAKTDSEVRELIQKKSMIDRMVPYGDEYLSLTDLGVVTLNDLNVRNYRVSDNEFLDFVEESTETNSELKSIAERGSFYVSRLKAGFPGADVSQLWSVSIGLAKLWGDPNQIYERFQLALGILQHFSSTIENKMMAAEIITSLRAFSVDPSQLLAGNSDLQNISETLTGLDKELEHRANVPKQLAAGIAATILYGREYDGTYPVNRYEEYSKITASNESAAILATMNVPTDQLTAKFHSFRWLFNTLGYSTSEDSELASAYLAISDFGPDDVRTKMTMIIDALKVYLEYPLVAAAILTSIPTLEANETLDLLEKAYSLLWAVAAGLSRSELISLSVRMIHGINNELVKKLDPTARIVNTPVQFTSGPSFVFFPLIVAHHSYFATYSGIGGAHPAHSHGVGGFSG